MSEGRVYAGLDVGSTTVKLVVADEQGSVLFRQYVRHHARLAATAADLLDEAAGLLPEGPVTLAVCGSGGRPLAEKLDAPYVQEVVANSLAVCTLYPQASCAIELGGQDAKVVFFEHDADGTPRVGDMRMNGSCAGGTGAFIDEVAKLLDVDSESFDELARTGEARYQVSGRCGVFAKTDIQPLLSRGADRADVAASACQAIAKQVIGGLAQGLALTPPIVFEGGPFTYNPTLIRAFVSRLHLSEDDAIVPAHPETMVAFGAALYAHDRADAPETDFAQLAWAARAAAQAAPARSAARPLFSTEADKDRFLARLATERGPAARIAPGTKTDAYLGIDCGSTTSKGALVDGAGNLLASFYTHNDGDALRAVREGIAQIEGAVRDAGATVTVRGACTTGYGEEMLARALRADCHTVETVAHATAALSFAPDTSFVLDIGGQDMKALFVHDGTVTNVLVNEACSSGCGSFLETLAASLGVAVEDIADRAFASRAPAHLGSRCTVFMTSTVITAQRDGATASDILAGLCRSVIENVFTKVVRVRDVSELGPAIMVQGGTFENAAVVRAMEEHVGRPVRVAPYPGLMGAIGAALYVRNRMGRAGNAASSFIGFDGVRNLKRTSERRLTCSGCANGCAITVTAFSSGAVWATGNRCSKGERLAVEGDSRQTTATDAVPNLFKRRAALLRKRYVGNGPTSPSRGTIGIPLVLEFWNSLPFWRAFLESLGYTVILSRPSSQELYESGLAYVASDTVCLPAKLVHGHVLDLCRRGAKRILLPHIMHLPPEGKDPYSPYMCSIVMGYPMVVRNFQDPEANFDVRFDTPVFHWFTDKDRRRQLEAYATDELGASAHEAREAIARGEAALSAFQNELRDQGDEVRRWAREHGTFAVVLAGRPYHSDPFLSHAASDLIAAQGVPVLPVDALRDMDQVDLHHARAEITNNFHTRMLEGAAIAATDPDLEYVQIVSFGCGHDAILTDEIARIMKLCGGKHPLVLKLDESEATGSLAIRIRSFLATVRTTTGAGSAAATAGAAAQRIAPADIELPDPFPVKFAKKDKGVRTILIPNISEEVSILLEGVMASEGYLVQTVPVGGIDQIHCGKRYTHNDICFPCQMVIGELICALQEGGWRDRQDQVAVGMVKFQCDCRMSHYAALLRMALDNAGFADVPVITTDPVDPKGAHPGVKLLDLRAVVKAVRSFTMLDLLAAIKRRQEPYEREPGRTERVYFDTVRAMAAGVQEGGDALARAYREGVAALAQVPLVQGPRKPRVLVTGELLVTYHPGSNFHIERFLEDNGMEPIFPRFTDQLRKDFLAAMAEVDDFGAKLGHGNHLVSKLFDLFQGQAETVARTHPLYEPEPSPNMMYEGVRDIIPKTLSCGEGWLMAAEIAHYADEGVKPFVILQPFGCLPNHVCGRGVTKRLKADHPGIQILPLDLDPDTSPANVENRLQMLVMSDARLHEKPAHGKA